MINCCNKFDELEEGDWKLIILSRTKLLNFKKKFICSFSFIYLTEKESERECARERECYMLNLNLMPLKGSCAWGLVM